MQPTTREKQDLSEIVAYIRIEAGNLEKESDKTESKVSDNLWVTIASFINKVTQVAKEIANIVLEVTFSVARKALEGGFTLQLPGSW